MVPIENLKKLQVFQKFNTNEIEKIIYCATEEFFPADTIVLEESRHSKNLYVILEGRVAVEMKIPALVDKNQVERISVINAEHVFGELAFIEGTARSARIRTIDPTKVLMIDAEKAHKLFSEDYELGYKMMRNLAIIVCDRLRNINFMWRNIISDFT